VDKDLKHNFTWSIIHEALWGFAFGLVSPWVLLPLALKALGGSARLGGLTAALVFTGQGLLQAWSAIRLRPRWSDPHRAAWLHAPAVASTCLAGLWMLLSGGLGPAWRLAGLLLFATGHYFFLGMLVPQWLACVTRCVPASHRGRYFGAIYFTGAVGGVLGGLLGPRLAGWGGVTLGFGLAFCLAGLAQAISASLVALYRPLAPRPKPHKGRVLPALAGLLSQARREPALGRSLMLLVMLTLAAASYSLFTLALKERGVGEAWFSGYAALFNLGGMAGSLALGWFCDHHGIRSAGRAAFLVLLATLALMLKPLPAAVGLAAFLGAGFYQAAFPVLSNLMLLALGRREAPARAAGLVNTLLAPVTALAPFITGQIAGAWGYAAAFATAMALCLMGLGLISASPQLDKERA
jgi:predicted MFS family arabinose efflux permease